MNYQKIFLIGFAAVAAIAIVTLGLAIAAFVKANKKSTSSTSVSFGSTNSPTISSTPSLNQPRIPPTLSPESYYVTITPNLNKFTFEGSVEIVINCLQSTDEIWLYIAMLEFDLTNVFLIDSNQNKISILNRTIVANQQELSIFKLAENLTVGMNYEMKFINFSGLIQSDSTGFYAINFTNFNQPQTIFVTQSECCYMRRIFPSFDEPKFKSKFQLSLEVPLRFSVTSNTQPEFINSTGELKKVKFGQTFPMATYLFAFSIFENFVNSSVFSAENNFYVNAWIRSELAEQIGETASFEAKVLDFYSSYFDFKFPYPKLDMIVEPLQGFAEEDWGQITYGEWAGLLNDQMAPSARLEPHNVIAHETAHQWTGDLVTCSWWSDTWVNEGFATFFATIGQRVYTNFSDENFWFHRGQQVGFAVDSDPNSAPLVEPIANDCNIIESKFGSGTYFKGATILNTIRWILGDEKFQKAISEYFRTFQYKSVLTSDFLSIMEKYSSNISSVMQNWIYGAGFPVLTAERRGNFVFLEQNPFTNYTKTSNEFIWAIPLWFQKISNSISNNSAKNDNQLIKNNSILNNSATNGYELITNNSISNNSAKNGYLIDYNYQLIKNNLISNNLATNGYELITNKSSKLELESDLVIFNPDAKAMIIVNYDFETWLNIANLLKTNHKILSPITRAYLLHNAKNLFEIGKTNCTVLWELVQFLGDETEFTVWTTFFQTRFDFVFTESCGFQKEKLENFVNSVFDKIGLSTNFPTNFPELLSEIITKYSCKFGYKNCTKAVLERGEKWFECIKTPGNFYENCTNLLNPAHRAPIYCELAKNVVEAKNYLENRLCKQFYPLTDQNDLTQGLQCTGWKTCPQSTKKQIGYFRSKGKELGSFGKNKEWKAKPL